MAFLVDEAYLPAILTVGPMTDEAFAQLCAERPDLNFELSAQGELIVMPPTYTWTGARNNQISRQLGNRAERDGRGVAFDSSTGWLLPDGARRSPDAAWLLKRRSEDIDAAAFSRCWHVRPDFVNIAGQRITGQRIAGQGIAGQGPVEGFVPELAAVWNPLKA